MVNTRLPVAAGCAGLAALAATSLGGCTAGMPSGALAATAGSGAVADVSEAPLVVAPEDIDGHGFGGGMHRNFGGGRGGGGGAFDATGALGKGR